MEGYTELVQFNQACTTKSTVSGVLADDSAGSSQLRTLSHSDQWFIQNVSFYYCCGWWSTRSSLEYFEAPESNRGESIVIHFIAIVIIRPTKQQLWYVVCGFHHPGRLSLEHFASGPTPKSWPRLPPQLPSQQSAGVQSFVIALTDPIKDDGGCWGATIIQLSMELNKQFLFQRQ